MRKIDTDGHAKVLSDVMESIAIDAEQGKLSSNPDTHPFRKVSLPAVEGTQQLSTEDLTRLIAVRMDLLGYTFFHDPNKAKRTVEDALSKLKGLEVKKS